VSLTSGLNMATKRKFLAPEDNIRTELKEIVM
jgi:hypothetical protein